jgi:hypothetical protein
MAFHGLFLDPGDYGRAGASPFPFSTALSNCWTSPDQKLSTEVVFVPPPAPVSRSEDDHVQRIAESLIQGHRVAVESPKPITELATAVWSALPMAVRAHASVATWAFANGNRFDLLALPKLKRTELDTSYLDPTATIVRQ